MMKQLFLTTAALLAVTPAVAQETATATGASAGELGDIVVTATKRNSRIQDTPISIQALTGEALTTIGALSVNDYLDKVPGLTSFGNGGTRNNFTIRGIANVAGSYPTVGYYLDETPISDIGAPSVDLFDVDRIEILKGPQGTLFGEGSIGGLIRVITTKPDFDTLSGRASLGVSTIKSGSEIYRVAGAINVPLSSTFAVRASGSYVDDGGFIDNRSTGTRDINYNRTLSLRLAARWQATDGLTLTPSLTYQRYRQGADNFNNPTGGDPVFVNAAAGNFSLVDAAPNGGDLTLSDNRFIARGTDLTVASAFDPFSRARFYLPALTIAYSGDGFDIVSATSYYDFSRSDLRDDRSTAADFRSGLDQLTAFGVLPFRVPLPRGFPLAGEVRVKTFTQEVRIVSTGDGPFNWVVGGFYRDRKTDSSIVETAPDLGALFGVGTIFSTVNSVDYRQIAAFGEASYEVTPRLTVTGGVRIFEEKIDALSASGTFVQGGPPTFLPSFIQFAPIGPSRQSESDAVFKASIKYEFTDRAMAYALFSQGFRAGGINTRIVPAGANPALPGGSPIFYGSETLDNYELGIKTTFLYGRVLFNLAGFILETRDPQLPVEVIPGFVSTVNANNGLARSKGFEVEAQFRPVDWLDLGVSAAYTDAKLVNVGTNGTLVAGSLVPNTPKFKSSVYAQGDIPVTDKIRLLPRVDYDHTGKRFVGPSRDPQVAARPPFPAYDIVNLQLGVAFEKFTLTGFVSNVTDERAVLSSQSFRQLEGLVINRPRTVGVRLDAGF